jgi:hypothetical protein
MFNYKTLEERSSLDVKYTVYIDSYKFEYVNKGEDYFKPHIKKLYERKRAIAFDKKLVQRFCKGELSMFQHPDFDRTFLKSEKKL